MRRLRLLAEAPRLVGVRRRRLGDGVGAGRRFTRLAADAPGEREEIVFAPRHLELAHPEGIDLHLDLRALVWLTTGLVRGAAHHERPAGNRDHLEAHGGVGDRLCVPFELRGSRLCASLLTPTLSPEGRGSRENARGANRGGDQQESMTHQLVRTIEDRLSLQSRNQRNQKENSPWKPNFHGLSYPQPGALPQAGEGVVWGTACRALLVVRGRESRCLRWDSRPLVARTGTAGSAGCPAIRVLARDAAEVGVVRVGFHAAQVRVVEEVEDLGAELHLARAA